MRTLKTLSRFTAGAGVIVFFAVFAGGLALLGSAIGGQVPDMILGVNSKHIASFLIVGGAACAAVTLYFADPEGPFA